MKAWWDKDGRNEAERARWNDDRLQAKALIDFAHGRVPEFRPSPDIEHFFHGVVWGKRPSELGGLVAADFDTVVDRMPEVRYLGRLHESPAAGADEIAAWLRDEAVDAPLVGEIADNARRAFERTGDADAAALEVLQGIGLTWPDGRLPGRTGHGEMADCEDSDNWYSRWMYVQGENWWHRYHPGKDHPWTSTGEPMAVQQEEPEGYDIGDEDEYADEGEDAYAGPRF